jgi:surface protein
MSNNLYIKGKSSSSISEDWVRPSDWLPMPTNITSSDQIFVGLHAVIEDNDNYVAFLFTTSAGQYQVDWGDGSTPTLHNSNTIAQYQYNFATVSNTTLSSRGYKQAIITVTPVSGDFLICNFQQRFATTPAQNQTYSTGFLDCILSMPNASASPSIFFGGAFTVFHNYLEKFEIKTIGQCNNIANLFNSCFRLQKVSLLNIETATSLNSMFFSCYSLKSVDLFDTSNVTNMSNMFQNCTSLKTVPLFNTSNVTTMLSMFQSCNSLESVPLFDTTNVTNMSGMFTSCFSLKTVPLFDTQNVTTISTMFQNCYSLQFIPLFNTQNVVSMNQMFLNTRSLNVIPALSTVSITPLLGSNFGSFSNSTLSTCKISFARSVELSSCQLSRDALVEIFTNLVDRTSTTSANINILSNWGATALSTVDRDIALNKNWTISG